MQYQQQISPISMSIDCLNSTKYFVLRDAQVALESSTPQLRQVYSRMAQEHLSMADEWFRMMQERGWYQVPEARPEIISQAMNQLQTVRSESQVRMPATMQPTPQPNMYTNYR